MRLTSAAAGDSAAGAVAPSTQSGHWAAAARHPVPRGSSPLNGQQLGVRRGGRGRARTRRCRIIISAVRALGRIQANGFHP